VVTGAASIALLPAHTRRTRRRRSSAGRTNAARIGSVSVSSVKFPRRRFMAFLKELRVQTKDYGLQRMDRLLGTQRYLLDEIEKGMEKGQTTFVVLKARQLGMTTICAALDLFWMMEHPGLSGAMAAH